MTSFTYTITHPTGLHARPAAQLVEVCRGLNSQVTITKGERSAPIAGLVALMLLEIHRGDTITVALEGPKEQEEAAVLQDYFQNNL